jgi:hypothetical protein
LARWGGAAYRRRVAILSVWPLTNLLAVGFRITQRSLAGFFSGPLTGSEEPSSRVADITCRADTAILQPSYSQLDASLTPAWHLDVFRNSRYVLYRNYRTNKSIWLFHIQDHMQFDLCRRFSTLPANSTARSECWIAVCSRVVEYITP